MLLTLGGLKLPGTRIRREKPLLLVAYLALEGPQPRRKVAELFWPEATDVMNSLAVSLSFLRQHNLIEADEARVWTQAQCDAATLREHLRSGQVNEALELYRGAFADGVRLNPVEDSDGDSNLLNPDDFDPDFDRSDLQNWVYETREALAGEMRGALLSLAEREASKGAFAEGAGLAESAYRLPGAKPLEVEELIRAYRVLLAAEHPACKALEHLAQEMDITLNRSADTARGKLRQTLLGRQRELGQLQSLKPGEWAWLKGASGMGKTTLLRELESRGLAHYLPARSGLPYATLEPLLPEMEGSEELWLRRLKNSRQNLLIDDWQALDPESQKLLGRLRTLRPEFWVIVASHEPAPFNIDHHLEISPLSAQDLAPYPGMYEATDGVPTLVGGWLRGEPLEQALESRLTKLCEEARGVYAALTLLDKEDLGLVRQALGFSAPAMAKGVEELTAVGLIEPSGRVRGRETALRYLAVRPSLEAKLSLALARRLKGEAAFLLYRKARALWEDADLAQVQQAYIVWGKGLLQRGFPQRVAEALEEAPEGPEVLLLKARALERMGMGLEVLDLLAQMPDAPELQAMRSSVLYRLGRLEEALEAANVANGSDSMEAKAEGSMTLGKLALAKGEYVEAEGLFKRAGTLWLTVGQRHRWVDALTNQAISRSDAGNLDEEGFRGALEAAGESMQSKALVLLNLSVCLNRKERYEDAITIARQALVLADECGDQSIAASIWQNLGTDYEHTGEISKAKDAYANSLELSRTVKDKRLTGLSWVFLSAINRDISSGEEAIKYLEASGFRALAEVCRQYLGSFMDLSGDALHS